VSVLIRRITLAALMAALVGGTLALPASSKPGPVAHASKCKKGKKGKRKKKKCKGAGQSGTGLPGQATHPNVTPPAPPPTFSVTTVGVTDSTVLAGTGTSGQVTISDPAPSGGKSVDLQSSDTSVTLPTTPATTVVVAAGQTTATFSVGTTLGTDVTATLTASIGSSNATTQLRVVSAPSVESVSLQRQCFTPGSFSANRVTLDVPAPADTPVTLLSDDSSALSVPGSVVVPLGSKTAFFTATAGTSNPLVTVTATLGPSVTDTGSVSASSPTPDVATLTIQPNSVTVGSSPTGTVTLNCEAPSGGTIVSLSSDLPGVTVPPTVTVPQDQLSAPFTINANASGTATISADTAGTGGPQQATLDVNNLGT
jgi:hypothetical protein